jgi:hypothetical protein
MEIRMKEIGKMIKPMGMEYMCMPKQGQDTKGIGRKICSMAQECKYIQMGIDMKVCSSKAKEMGKAPIIYLTALSIKGNGLMAELKAKAFANGRMASDIKDHGLTTKSMGMEYIHGQMAEDMKGNIKMIKSMAQGLTLGRMEGSIKENGKMIKDMGKVNT